MKLKDDFITYDTESESLLVPAGTARFSGLVKGNRTLGVILEMLKTDTSEAEIVSALEAKFDAPAGAIERDVRKALTELKKIGALDA